MIGALRGTLLHRSLAGEVHVEVGGLGYRVQLSPDGALGLGAVGDEVFVWVHQHQREDGSSLYGFVDLDERVAFEALIGARGVGPALALSILAVHRPAALAQVLADDDLDALCLVPGIGKKTAARLLLELKARLDLPLDDSLPGASAPAGGAAADVRAALAELGYGPEEIREALRDAEAADDPSQLLRTALQRLAVPT